MDTHSEPSERRLTRGRLALILLLLPCLLAACGFAAVGPDPWGSPGFFVGMWHGLLAPWSLIARLVIDVRMYAFPNAGWFYDAGFLIGVVFSLPVGWICAIIAVAVYVLG